MPQKPVTWVLSTLLTLSCLSVGAEDLREPTVDYHLVLVDERNGDRQVVHRSGSRLRVDGGETVTISDFATGQSYILMEDDGEKVAWSITLPPDRLSLDPLLAFKAFEATDVSVQESGTETVAGHRCRRYNVTANIAGQAVNSGFCLSIPDRVNLIEDTREIPNLGGYYHAVLLEIGPQDPALFQVPAEYRIEEH